MTLRTFHAGATAANIAANASIVAKNPARLEFEELRTVDVIEMCIRDRSVHANGTKLYSARIIPFKGSWIEFATDINNVMYALSEEYAR